MDPESSENQAAGESVTDTEDKVEADVEDKPESVPEKSLQPEPEKKVQPFAVQYD